MNLQNTSWQERYHASDICTLRCKVYDQPGMLGRLITAIGQTHAHVGTISTVGIQHQSKIRDIQVFCSGPDHLTELLGIIRNIEGIEVLNVRDEVLEIHRRGTIETKSRVPITNLTDLRMLYTPGVASVCKKIMTNPAIAWEFTGLCDRVAIVTNGTAVLGLGNIGTVASLPVMEGKAAIFAEFADISAVPVLIDSEDVEEIVQTVSRISSGFGAIQLEDIAAPACFEVEEKLRERLSIPVLHDDQHGTATVVLAALINALQRTGKTSNKCSAIILGAGAAGYAIAMVLHSFGISDVLVCDSRGPIYQGRTERMNRYKQKLAKLTKSNHTITTPAGFKDRDIFVGVAQPDSVSKEMISSMAKDPIVLPLSNPVGEISVDDAVQAGAAIAADGRAINNALVYPGLFRGALDAKATDITMAMQLAAAKTLARLAPDDALLPDILDRDVHQNVANAVVQSYSG